MALVLLRAPLADLAGGREHALEGETVQEVLVALERTRPAISGWVLDERRDDPRSTSTSTSTVSSREEETAVGGSDRVHVLPAITGG